MEFAIKAILGILGAALVAGGFVAYRGSPKTGVRALAAAAVAAGVVMWVIVIITTQVSVSSEGGPAPSPTIILEDRSVMPVTVEDVARLLPAGTPLTEQYRDLKEAAWRVDPSQVENIDSWIALTFVPADGAGGVTVSMVVFDSESSAAEHFEKTKAGTPVLQDMAQPIGDASALARADDRGIGSILVFVKGDRVVTLHTAQAEGEQPLLSSESLEELARTAEQRLP
jgi:hypothetical protein